ncbi:alpha-amylase family protein [Arsenicicoccus dermatophilus]|uniref:alpha-amylase family protein n=1 Tax=Arsenicicoccus dermatophilus TaxID=1076331 RepID=UPI003916E9AA
MTWTDHVIWWHVYPLGAVGAPIHGGFDPAVVDHPLARLEGWLDHAIALGANGLQLGPIFASATHGYDTLDHYRIDPRLGDDADLDELVRRARDKGLRVLLDGVFNHVAWAHPLYQQALVEGPQSTAARHFRIDWSSGEARPEVFEGHGSLVALDHGRDEVVDLVADVMRHWLRRGIDGWRLDAAYAVDPHFWARVLPQVRAEFPEATFVGEVIHGDYAHLVRESTLDSVTQYELWKAVWSSLLDRNFWELDHALQRHQALLDTFVPMTFVGNHDVTRIASRVGQAKAVLAMTVLMTVAGQPSLYYGDEHGFEGVKEDREGGDDAVRPPLPQAPSGLSPLGDGTFRVHQALVAIRRRHPWLVRGQVETVELTNERMVYAVRPAPGAPEHGDPAAVLHVELDVTGQPRMAIRQGDATLLTHPA